MVVRTISYFGVSVFSPNARLLPTVGEVCRFVVVSC